MRTKTRSTLQEFLEEEVVAFYDFPKDHVKHLRTTNGVESATAMIRRRLPVAESRFRKLDAPYLAAAACRNVKFEDRENFGKPTRRAAA